MVIALTLVVGMIQRWFRPGSLAAFTPVEHIEQGNLMAVGIQVYLGDQDYLAAMAVFVACLGLLGLAIFSAERRVKEIGIRKVLGATVKSIVVLLSRDIVRLILLAFVVATPLAWYLMHRWLENFAYHIDIGFAIFLLAGGLTLLIAVGTISIQTIRAALANPAEAIRNE